MSTFARLVGGFAVDCQVAPNAAALASRFNPEWLARNPFVQVPDGTIDGAKDNGNGTFSNPTPPAPVIEYALLSASGFQELCESALGGGATGATRFGKIMRDIDASADDLIHSISVKFAKSTTFDRPKCLAAFAALVGAGIMTSGERSAIISGWAVK